MRVKYVSNNNDIITTNNPDKQCKYIRENYRYRGDINFMRIGRFSIITFDDDLFAFELYKGEPNYYIEKTSQFYETSKRDRLRQIETIKKHLKNSHPFFIEIMRDIIREIDHFA